MKKLLTTLGAFIFLLSPALVFAASTHHYVCSDFPTLGGATCSGGVVTFTPGNNYISDTVPVFTLNPPGGPWYISYTASSGSNIDIDYSGNHFSGTQTDTLLTGIFNPGLTMGNFGSSFYVGTIGDICITDTPGDCSAPPPPPPPPSGIAGEITAAEAGFSSTTGFDIIGLINWSGTNLVALFVGSGLALLYELRFWIVALLVIAGVIYFAFRAFQFFRH
jgi:hypothetical protein